jgi:hypothetical protein
MEEKLEKIAEKLIGYNTYDYNILKLIEELQELSLVLTQAYLKPSKVDQQEIIDEIGDVKIRMAVLDKILNQQPLVNERIEFKLKKFEKLMTIKKAEKV